MNFSFFSYTKKKKKTILWNKTRVYSHCNFKLTILCKFKKKIIVQIKHTIGTWKNTRTHHPNALFKFRTLEGFSFWSYSFSDRSTCSFRINTKYNYLNARRATCRPVLSDDDNQNAFYSAIVSISSKCSVPTKSDCTYARGPCRTYGLPDTSRRHTSRSQHRSEARLIRVSLEDGRRLNRICVL